MIVMVGLNQRTSSMATRRSSARLRNNAKVPTHQTLMDDNIANHSKHGNITEAQAQQLDVCERDSSDTGVSEGQLFSSSVQPVVELTAIQKARMENSKQKALQLKRAQKEQTVIKSKLQQTINMEVDSGAGFFIEEDDEPEIKRPMVIEQAAPDPNDEVRCDDCNKLFTLSLLRSKFGVNVCDGCRWNETHQLITKTTAKTKYLLKDEDFDKREPPLRCITKRNPHSTHWGDMKLYLESQCSARALEIWGSEEYIEEEIIKRKILSAKARAKKYDKKMKELKMEVRSSLYKKELSGHQHVFGQEMHNEDTDEYSKECTTCGHVMTYEKM